MQRIYKSNGIYTLFTQLSDGSWVMGLASKNIEKVLLGDFAGNTFLSEQEILDAGWTPYYHDNGELLVEGDEVEDENGNKITILGRHGIGESSLYHLSDENQPLNTGSDITAHDLKKEGFKRVTQTPATDTKAQEAIEYLEKVGRIKDGKVIGK